MAFDFPPSPSNGQTYTSGGAVFVWNGYAWGRKHDAVVIADAPPPATDNALWWESDSGTLFIRYNDGSSTQWVTAVPPVVGLTQEEGDLRYVNLVGDTMSGALVAPAFNPTNGGGLLNAGGANAYTVIKDGSNNDALIAGGTVNEANYYRNSNHYFQDRTGLQPTWVHIDPTKVDVKQATPSSAPSNGALTVTGGVGIAGMLNVGANLDVTGEIRNHYNAIGGTYRFGQGAAYLTFDGTNFTFAGGQLIAPGLNVSGAAVISGGLAVSGGQLIPAASAGGTIAAAPGGYAGLEVRSNAADAAFLSFHRLGTFAAHLGIDTDNQLKIGGWSYGAASHVIWHSGNHTPSNYLPLGGGTLTGVLTVTGGISLATGGLINGPSIMNYSGDPNKLTIVGGVNGFQFNNQANSVALANMNNFGSMSFVNASASTLPTNGAFVIAGGLGVGGTVNVGGGMSVSGSRSWISAPSEVFAIGLAYSEANRGAGKVVYIGATDEVNPDFVVSNNGGTPLLRVDGATGNGDFTGRVAATAFIFPGGGGVNVDATVPPYYYTVMRDRQGEAIFWGGDVNDPVNYFNNAKNWFGTRGGAPTYYAFLDATQFNIEIATPSTGPTNGAFVVEGGVGISGRMYLGAGTHGPAACAMSLAYAAAGTQYGILIRPASDANANAMYFYNAAGSAVGAITTTGANTAYGTSSDARRKDDLKPLDAGKLIDKLKTYDFRWKGQDERGFGVMAQEAAKVVPQACHHNDTDDTWMTDYSKFVPLLLAEVKALRARVAELEGAR